MITSCIISQFPKKKLDISK